MKLNLILITLCSLLFVSCSNNHGAPMERTNAPDYAKIGFQKPQWKEIENPILQVSKSACEYLSEVRDENIISEPQFSIFKKLYIVDGKFTGRVNIINSPFTRFYLGESFSVPSDREFYEAARAEYEAGRLGEIAWRALQAAYKTGIGFDTIKYSTLNDKILEGFPGVFGEDSDSESSLYAGLIKKASYFENKEPSQKFNFARVNKKDYPVFLSRSWQSLDSDSLNSVTSALNALYNQNDMKEKQCANLLLQRSFSQLLKIKGFKSVNYEGVRKYSRIKKLDAEKQPEFSTHSELGSFVNLNGQAQVLSSEAIGTYDPKKMLLPLFSKEHGRLAGSTENIAFLRAMLNYYQASSPAQSFVSSKSNYLLGDITKDMNALLPSEFHSLSLGLMIMNFKNIAALNMVKINSSGTELKPNQTAAGVLIGDKVSGSSEIILNIQDIAKLASAVIHMERSLNLLKTKSPEDLEKLNSTYSIPTLIGLMGTEMFSLEDIQRLIPDYDPSSSLISNLKALQLPLAQLLIAMRNGEVCVSKLSYDLQTSKKQAYGVCSTEIKEEVRQAINLIAKHNNSAILWQNID